MKRALNVEGLNPKDIEEVLRDLGNINHRTYCHLAEDLFPALRRSKNKSTMLKLIVEAFGTAFAIPNCDKIDPEYYEVSHEEYIKSARKFVPIIRERMNSWFCEDGSLASGAEEEMLQIIMKKGQRDHDNIIALAYILAAKAIWSVTLRKVVLTRSVTLSGSSGVMIVEIRSW